MAEVFNHDMVMIYNMCNRVIRECVLSQSSGVSGMIEHDRVRCVSYLNALDALKAWQIDQPQLDLPETHPKPFPLEAEAEVVDAESEVINMMVNLMLALRNECTNSASSRLPSGMLPADSKRFDLITNKCRSFLSDYVEGQTPLDFPESSPDEAMTGAGRRGV